MGKVETQIRAAHPHGKVEFWVDIELSRAGSVPKAARAIGVSTRTLYRWIAANGFTVHPYRTVWLVKDGQRPGASSEQAALEGAAVS